MFYLKTYCGILRNLLILVMGITEDKLSVLPPDVRLAQASSWYEVTWPTPNQYCSQLQTRARSVVVVVVVDTWILGTKKIVDRGRELFNKGTKNFMVKNTSVSLNWSQFTFWTTSAFLPIHFRLKRSKIFKFWVIGERYRFKLQLT